MVAISSNAVQSDQGSAVLAVTYVFIVITVILTTLRIVMALIRSRKFGLDDVFLVLAVIFGFLSAICMGTAVMNGLGRTISTVHANQLGRYFKLSYASHIFTFFAVAAAQSSVVALCQRLAPVASPIRKYVKFIYPVIGIWMLLSVFGVAFQCDVPDPWIYSPTRCKGHGAVWYPIAVLCILTDIVLALVFLPIIRETQLSKNKKTTTSALFLARLIVPIFSIAHIATLASALSSVDQTSTMTTPSILLQISMNLSILTALVPVLSRTVLALHPTPSTAVVSEITTIPLDASRVRSDSDENSKLRDWAFAQLRNSTPTPTPTLTKEMESPKKPQELHLRLDRNDTAPPPIPQRSERRSASPSPRLTLNLGSGAGLGLGEKQLGPGHLDVVKEAWFVDSNRSSALTENTIDELKRMSQRDVV